MNIFNLSDLKKKGIQRYAISVSESNQLNVCDEKQK